MAELPEVLSRKIGPLPAGGWLLAIAGGMGVAYLINRQAGTPDAEPLPEDMAEDTSSWEQGGETSTPGGVGNNNHPAPTYPVPAAERPPRTNNEWRTRAVRALIENGRNSWRANQAVSAYLRGRRLTDNAQALVGEAIALVGPTPQPVPLPKPATRRKPKPKPRDDKPKPKPNPGPGRDGGGRPRTNEEWRERARRRLLREGFKGERIKDAFHDYFTSSRMTDGDRRIVRRAITLVGQPPHPPRDGGRRDDDDRRRGLAPDTGGGPLRRDVGLELVPPRPLGL